MSGRGVNFSGSYRRGQHKMTQRSLRQVHCVALLAFGIRVIYAFISDEILHPDEIMQYPEQAHRLVYGYGFVPWEYRAGIRSWLLPCLISLPIAALRLVGLDRPGVYILVITLIACLLSCSLVYSCYFISRAYFPGRAGIYAAILAATWYELIIFSQRVTPEVFGTYMLTISMAMLTGKLTTMKRLASGLLMGLAIALRYQYALAAMAGIICFNRGKRRQCFHFYNAAGVVAALTISGFIDWYFLKDPLAPYLRNYKYNMEYGISSLFGTEDCWYYPRSILMASGFILVSCALAIIVKPLLSKSWASLPIAPVVIIAVLIVSHSFVPHKEYRFIFLALPFLVVLASGTLAWLSERRSRWARLGLCSIVLGIASSSALGIAGSLPGSKGNSDQNGLTQKT